MINILLLITLFCNNVQDDFCEQEMIYCIEKSKMSYEWCIKHYYDY